MKHNTGIHCTCPLNQSSTTQKSADKYSSIWSEKKKEMQSYHCYSSHGDGTSTKIHIKHLLSSLHDIFQTVSKLSIWFDICYPIFPENIPMVSILCSTFFSSYKAFLAGKRNTKIYVDDLMITNFLNIHISYWKGHACIRIIYLQFVI